MAIRYRYYEEAPGTVTRPAGELLARLPGELSRGGETGDRTIEIPCGDLLTGNTPRIALSRLQELVPDLVQIPEGRDLAEKIALPPGWIALHFKLVTRREELPPEEVPAPPALAKTPSEEKTTSEVTEAAEKKEAKEEPKAQTKEAEPVAPKPIAEAVLVEPVTTPVSEPASEAVDLPKQRRGLFASLPIFRRRPAVEAPPVEGIQVVPGSEKTEGDIQTTPKTKPEAKKNVPVVMEESKETASIIPAAPQTSAASLALEPLWKLSPQDQLAEPTALQSLFMTEEKLTLERVISKAGELPGLKACVLAHGDKVLCTSNTAAGIDLKTLSGRAMTMLGQIRESSASMGLGAVPAVTLHAEQGALSFLHNGELCLLVLHADRGFVPGVRERLQEMLGHLTDARPALPGGSPAVEGRGSKDESR